MLHRPGRYLGRQVLPRAMSCGELTAVCQTWLAVGSGSDAEPAIKLVGVHAPCTVSDLPPDATALGAVFSEGSAIVWVQPTTGMSKHHKRGGGD